MTAMKSLEFNLMLVMLLGLLSSIIDPSRVVLVESRFQNLGTITTDGGHDNRRILHQPLFPVSSAPPPVAAEAEPPPPESSDIPGPDEPFFPEIPTNPTPDQTQTPPAPSASNVSTTVPMATQPANSNKKVAIAISVVIVTLGMLSALAFFLYRHRVNHPSESQKLVGGNSERFTEESSSAPNRPGPLYLGTVQPSSRRGGGGGGDNEGTEEATGSSPYQKLRSIRSSELHRPSPELQPLPPLNRAPRGSSPPAISYEAQYRTSPSVMSSEDAFYTPQGSAVSNGSPVPRQIFPANGSASAVAVAAPVSTVKTVIHTANSTPISRRTSPKSRLSNSSPDVKQAIVPSPSPSSSPPSPQSLPLPPPPPLPRLSQSPPKRRPKLPSPPSPPPNLVLPKSINDSTSKTSKNAAPLPPPPPPPPPPMMAKKDACSQKSISVMSVRAEPRNQSIISTPKTGRWQEKPVPTLEATTQSNAVEDTDEGKPRLKPLHWDKVRASSDRATVWDQLKSSSFQLNEDMIETLFGCNSKNPPKKELSRRSTLPPPEQEDRVLDPKKSQNIAILLRALNVTRDEVTEALLDGNPESLGAELLETLVKMAPTKEEELKLKDYRGDISKLGSAERFLKAVLDIPFSFKRVDVMLYRANFDAEVNYLRKSFETLEAACEELRNSRLFMKLLEAVLRTGNRMNVGTNRGDARAFKLDTLLKLVDIKGIDGKTTLLHFVVQEIIRSEGAGSGEKTQNPLDKMNQKGKDDNNQKQDLQIVAGLGRELANVKKAAGMDSDVLSSYVSKLEAGLDKVRLVLQYENSNTQGKFFEAMKLFLDEAKEEILRVKADEKKALLHVKEVTEYFHGDTAKEEAHPFRIFMVVRDFLAVLDQVCKEVGKMQNGMVGAARSFRISAIASLPVLNRFNIRKEESSDDDSLSS